jgi:hypothetical protein
MITFEFSIEETNHLLTLLGRLPFADSNSIIRMIVEQAQPQVPVSEEEKKAADAE